MMEKEEEKKKRERESDRERERERERLTGRSFSLERWFSCENISVLDKENRRRSRVHHQTKRNKPLGKEDNSCSRAAHSKPIEKAQR